MGQVPNKCIKNVKKHQLGSMSKLQTNVAPHIFFALVCQLGAAPCAHTCHNIWGRTPPRLAKEKKALRFEKKLQKHRCTYWGLGPHGPMCAWQGCPSACPNAMGFLCTCPPQPCEKKMGPNNPLGCKPPGKNLTNEHLLNAWG